MTNTQPILLFRVTTFQTTLNSLTFPVGAGNEYRYTILFNATVKSRCFMLSKNMPGTQRFKHCICDRLIENDNNVNDDAYRTDLTNK